MDGNLIIFQVIFKTMNDSICLYTHIIYLFETWDAAKKTLFPFRISFNFLKVKFDLFFGKFGHNEIYIFVWRLIAISWAMISK